MRKLQVKPSFLLTPAEVLLIQSLPAHTHDAKYSSAQSRGINNAYYRVFGTGPHAEALLVLAGKTKFPDDKSKTQLHRQRDVLYALMTLQLGIETPPMDYLTLLLNTMAASNPLNVMLVGIVLEAYTATPTIGEYLHRFDDWATDPQLLETHSPEFVAAITAEYERLHAPTPTQVADDFINEVNEALNPANNAADNAEGGRPASDAEGQE